MTWFRVDDKLSDHHKARAAGVPAMGLWVLAGSWCATNETDGFVPMDVVIRWDKGQRLAKKLVDCELWLEDKANGEFGYRFHQWEEHQPLRSDLEAGREQMGYGGERGNHLRWHTKKGVVKEGCKWCQK